MADTFKNDNELDRWLRENAGAEERPPAKDGWDTPSPQVWSGVRAGLDRRKKRRRAFWFWGTALLAVLSGLGLWLYFPESGTTAATPLAALEPAPQTERLSSSPTPSVSGLAAGPETDNSPSIPNPALYTKTRPFAGHKSPKHPAKPQKPNVNTTEPALSERNTGTATASPAVPASLPDRPETRETDISAPAPVDAGGIIPTTQEPATLAGRLPTPIDLIPHVAPPDHIRPRNDLDRIPVVIQPVRPKYGWYAGLAGGAFFTTRNLKAPADLPALADESGAWTQQYGATVGFRLNRHWALETGLQWTAVHLRAVRRVNFRYRTMGEQFDAQNFVYRNSDSQTLETSFGAVEMRMDIGREPSRPIQDQAIVQLILSTDEQVNYLRLPLLLRWSTGHARWRWSVAGGIGVNVESGYDLSLTAARANRPGVRNISARIQNRASGLTPLMLDAQFGAGLDCQITPAMTLRLAPEVRYGLNPMYQKGQFRSTAIASGIQLGMMINLK